MRRRVSILFLAAVMILVNIAAPVFAFVLPEGFVYVTDVIETALLDVRYYGNNNFIGTRIDGYEAPTAVLTEEGRGVEGRSRYPGRARFLHQGL